MEVKTLSQLIDEGKEADILFWVGSAGSFDDKAKKITRAFVKIMNKCKINFGVLGTEESSTGDAAKRAGNEFLFQMQAMMNIELLNSYKVKKIVTTCPHAYNIFKNEYKDLGGVYEVFHHTEFIYDLIKSGKLEILGDLAGKQVTYHDPCYLGRANSIYDAPRKLINLLGVNLIEVKRNKHLSFCCGAGGSQMFKDPEKGDKDINIERTEEILQSQPDIIATACPFCNIMLRDGVQTVDEDSCEVLDIAELISGQL